MDNAVSHEQSRLNHIRIIIYFCTMFWAFGSYFDIGIAGIAGIVMIIVHGILLYNNTIVLIAITRIGIQLYS